MANLQNYNGRYCESEFEYAFLSFLEAEGWHYLHGNSIPRENKTAVLYADDMEQFLSKNPGLRSRIAFHVPFADYNSRELCAIADRMASNMGFTLEEGAKERLVEVFEAAAHTADFGNGRFARNVIEKAKMAQANRLMQMDFAAITDADVFTLTAADVELPLPTKQDKVIPIGFCA